MESITKPSITRLARRAGVKSVSDDCFDTVRSLINNQLSQVVRAAMVVNDEHQTKTLMVDDVFAALRLLGHQVTSSGDLGTQTCGK